MVKLLGKHFSYIAIKERVHGIWKLRGDYDVIDMGFRYFLVKFDLVEVRNKAVCGGSWMLNYHYLMLKQWTPSFKPCEASFRRTMAWIRLTGMNILYYEEKVVSRIVFIVGRPI